MRSFLPTLAAAFAAIAIACGNQDSAESTAGRVAEELEDNVEQSAETMKDTYDEARQQGEGAVEAAGDAYNKVLEEGAEKADQ